MIGIYKITTGGKDYIGASKNIEGRWEEHKENAYRYNTAFYKSLRKDLNRNAARITLIRECSINELAKLEEYFIIKYDTYFNGWNNTLGAGYENSNDKIW